MNVVRREGTFGAGGADVHRQGVATPAQRTQMLENDVQLATRTQVPVLVTAISREQRETCARLIHAGRESGARPFVLCAVEGSEPTGTAHGDGQSGGHPVALQHLFGEARGGTLFVDDVAFLSTRAQAELLSLLEERLRSVDGRRAGDAVRIIAGASRHLDPDRAHGAFCERLFYRLNVIHINLADHLTLNGLPLIPNGSTRTLFTPGVRRCLLCGATDIAISVSGRCVTTECRACAAILRIDFDPHDDPHLRARIERIDDGA